MMSSKPRLVVPYGLKLLLEGFSRAVVNIQPNNIAQFGSLYFTELLQFRHCHPALDMKDLVQEFHHDKVESWPEESDVCNAKQMTPILTEKVLQDRGVMGRDTPGEVCLKDHKPGDTSQQPCAQHDSSKTAVCPAGANLYRQLSVDKADVPCPEEKEEVTCTTGLIVPGPEDLWKCENEVAPPATPARPASPEPKREEPAPCPEPKREEPAPCPEPKREEPAPCPEPKREEPAPCPEPKREEPAPCPEPKREEPAPCPEPKREEPAPCPEPKREEPAPCPEPKREEPAPCPEPKREEPAPCPEPKREEPAPCPEPKREEPAPCPEPKREVKPVAPVAPCPIEPSVQKAPETERTISKPEEAPTEYIVNGENRAICKPQILPENVVEKVVTKPRPVTPTPKQEVPPCPVKFDTRAPKTPVVEKSPDRCKTPEKKERVQYDSSKSQPVSVLEKADLNLAKGPEKKECLIPKVEQIKAEPVPEKVDHAVSKPVRPTSAPTPPEKMPPCDVIADKVDRVISKSNIPPDQTTAAYTSVPPPEETPVPCPVPKVAVNASKPAIEPQVHHEVPSPRVTSAQGKDVRGATEVCAQGPTATYYEHQPPASENTAYVPAQDNTIAQIVRAMPETYANIEPKIVQGEQPAAFYGCPVAIVERRLPSAGRETEISPTPYQPAHVYYDTPSTGVRHDGMDGPAPCYIEQLPQEILVPSQNGKKQPDTYKQQPFASSYQYQSIQSAPVQQAAYRSAADAQNYHSSYKQEVMEGMVPKKEIESDQSNLWTLYRLTDLSQPKGGPPNTSPTSPLYLQNPNEHGVSHVNQQSWSQDQQVNQKFVQQMMPQMQRSNYMESQHCSQTSTMVSAPAYILSEEAKRRMNAPPYILVGSNVQEAHDWKAIPGHAVLSKNELNPQRRYAAIQVPVAMTADGCTGRMVTSNSASAGQDMNVAAMPLYYSVAVPLDESQRMSASQPYTHVGSEQRAAPMTSYINTQGPSPMVAGAASRRPSASAMCEQRNRSNARSGQPQ